MEHTLALISLASNIAAISAAIASVVDIVFRHKTNGSTSKPDEMEIHSGHGGYPDDPDELGHLYAVSEL